jgi:hypothetical protein
LIVMSDLSTSRAGSASFRSVSLDDELNVGLCGDPIAFSRD